MSDFESWISERPIPPVDPCDLQRVLALMMLAAGDKMNQAAAGTEPVALSFDTDLLARECTAGSDPEATGFRAMLLNMQQGDLSDWRRGADFDAIVFETMADLPLPAGLRSFDPEALIAELRRRTA